MTPNKFQGPPDPEVIADWWREYIAGPVRLAFQARHEEFSYEYPGFFCWNIPRWVIYFTPWWEDENIIAFQVNPVSDGEGGEPVLSKTVRFMAVEFTMNPEVDCERIKARLDRFLLSTMPKLTHPDDAPNLKSQNLGRILAGGLDDKEWSADATVDEIEHWVTLVCEWLRQNDKLYHIDDDPFEICQLPLMEVRTFSDNEAMLLNLFWSWVRNQGNYSWEACWEFYGARYNIPNPQGGSDAKNH